MAKRTQKWMTKDEALTKATGRDAAGRKQMMSKMDELIIEAKKYPVGHPRRKEIEQQLFRGEF
jgi:hypothetical protein